MNKRPLAERFWEKVDKNGPVMPVMRTKCWVWTASCEKRNGYGQLGIGGGRWERAHRVSWSLHVGTIHEDKCVLHHCDNPKCVRPDHLYLGTKKNNAQDRERRGRSNHAVGSRHGRYTHPGQTSGSLNGRAKLNEEMVRELLRRHFQLGEKKAALAREFKLSKTSVGHIVSGKLWPKVEGRV